MMIDYFAALFGGDRDRGSEFAATRLGKLIVSADLSAVGKAQFELLCGVCNGLETKDRCDAKDTLLHVLHGGLTEQQEYIEDITDGRFVNDRASSKANVLWGVGAERQHLRELIALIEELNINACTALLTRIEEVLAGHGDLSDRCIAVYAKMQSRRQL